MKKVKEESVFESLLSSINDAIEYEKGNSKKARTRVVKVESIPSFSAEEIKLIRNSLKLTQNIFASLMGVHIKTVEAWESGTNKPSGTAQRLLSIYKNNPSICENIVHP